MKRMTALTLALAVLVSMLAIIPAASADLTQYFVYTSNGKTLNLREKPTKNSAVVAKIPYGDEFWLEKDMGNGWAYGHWGGAFGYVMTRYLTKHKPDPNPSKNKEETKEEKDLRLEEEKLDKELRSEIPVSPFYVVVRATRTTGWINFRTGPSKITVRVASFADGKELLVSGETTNWYRATDPDTQKVGYINKSFVTVLEKEVPKAGEEDNGTEKLGRLDVNGEFNLTCKLPEGYKLEVMDTKGDKIAAAVVPQDTTKPELYLTIAYDELYGEVERMNEMSEEDLAVLENTFKEMDQVEISYTETGYGTKLLVARENGDDSDFVDILAIYKGYFVEFKMIPNEKAADQRLTDEQVKMCVDFLTDVDFKPVT